MESGRSLHHCKTSKISSLSRCSCLQSFTTARLVPNLTWTSFQHLATVIIVISISSPPDAAALQLRGAGASFPYSVYEQWSVSYRAHRIQHKDVSVVYNPVGSGSGRDAIINRPDETDFAGSDSLMSDDEKKAAPDLVVFPTLAGGIVLAYNLPTCTSKNGQRLNLTREHVVGIYNGTYTEWSDPSIQAVNMNCTLPNATIVVVARRDKSGTTKIFTSALSAFDDRWRDEIGIFSVGVISGTDTPVEWDPDVIQYFGVGNQDVSGLIRSIRYTIGYLSVGDAQGASIDYAALGNRNGHFISPTMDTLQAAMNSKANDTTLTPSLVDPELPHAYPIASYTYFIIYRTEMQDCEVATEILRYVTWFTSSQTAQREAANKGFATLSETMVDRVREEILEQVTCAGRSVMNMVRSAIDAESEEEQTWVVPVAITVPVFCLVVGAMSGYILFQRIKLAKMINMDDWNIPIEDIVFFYDEKMKVDSSGKSRFLRQKSVRSLKSIGEISEGSELLTQILQWPGKWRANTIGIRLIEFMELRVVTREMKKTMLWMRDSLINTNVVRFYGLTELDGDRYVIGDFCSKGTVLDVLQSGKYNLNTDFKVSVATEIASGMAFLHVNGMVHGMLTSACCMLDNKWTVKIADWEYFKLLSTQNSKKNPLLTMRARRSTGDKYEDVFRDFWTAPEILRSEFDEWPTQASDVYSYAIIIQELFTRDDPYYELADQLSPEQILQAIIQNRLRPEPSGEAPITIRQIMELAWSETPSSRPTFEQITKMLRRGRTGRKTIMDNMMEAMEDYTAHLEEEVEAKEASVQAIKTNLDDLLTEMVPSQVLSSMSAGEKVESKIYSALGVIMMEIVEWSSVTEVDALTSLLKFLDNLSTQIYQVVQKFRAFKPYSQPHCTQTFVVGFEQEAVFLGDRCHAVAHMALDLLKVASCCKPPNSKHAQLPVRLSAHVGLVASGTIGTTSPKFLLLGNGMDVSRTLLSNADVNTVKISRSLYSQLEKSPDFQFSAKEPEWITCNGTDIEAFVLTGRNSETIPISSDTSVDSGVDVDRPQLSLQQLNDHGKLKTISADDLESVPTKPISSKPDPKLEKPSFYVQDDERLSSKRHSRTNQRMSKSANSSSYKQQKRRDVRNGFDKQSISEFPTAQLNSLPLSRISENSDDSDVTINDSNCDVDNSASMTSGRKGSDALSTENTFVDVQDKITMPQSPPHTINNEVRPSTIYKSSLSSRNSASSLSSLHNQSVDLMSKIVSNVINHEHQNPSSIKQKPKRAISFSDHPTFSNDDIETQSADSGTEVDNQEKNEHPYKNGTIGSKSFVRKDNDDVTGNSINASSTKQELSKLRTKYSIKKVSNNNSGDRSRRKERRISSVRSTKDNKVHPR